MDLDYETIMKKIIYLITIASIISCKTDKKSAEVQATQTVSIRQELWGETDGKPVSLFTLKNNDVQIQITNYGGIITSWIAPDKNGNKSDIVLGFSTLDKYLAGHPSFGSLIGRYGNRIAKGKFSIGDTTYTLAVNNGENHLHGGLIGFHKKVWDAQTDTTGGIAKLSLHYLSVDGEEGYPGNLDVTVDYSLTKNNELIIEYMATTDKTTPINLTNHTYFNLTGDHSQNILDHTLVINADRYTPVDRGLIPTGELANVVGTPLDFTKPEKIGARIEELVVNGQGGYDHNYVINENDHMITLAAILIDSTSGRKIETYTLEPGIQLYTANNLNGKLTDSAGIPFEKYGGVCLETQHFPDSPNKPEFPSTLLHPGEKYQTITKYIFSVE